MAKQGESKLSRHLPLINTSYEDALYTRVSKYSNAMQNLNQQEDLGSPDSMVTIFFPPCLGQVSQPVKMLLVRPKLSQGRQRGGGSRCLVALGCYDLENLSQEQ